MSSSNLIKIFYQETRNEQTTDIISLAKTHCLRYIPGYELKPAAASVRGGRTTAMRSTSFLLGVLLPRVLDPDPGSQEGTGRGQLKVQSLEKSHRGQLQPGPAKKLLSSEFHCRILCTPAR